MQNGDEKKKRQLKDPLRLVVLKEETLEEVSSYRLSLLNLYLLISTVLIIVAAIVVSLIFFTPLKRTVPGYAEIENNREYMALYTQVRELEKQVTAQKLYTDNFRKLIQSSIDTTDVPGEIRDVNLSQLLDNYQADRSRYANVSPSGNENGRALEPVIRKTSNLKSNSSLDYLYFVAPINGKVSAGFDAHKDHLGVDILANKNTPVKAILDGRVISSDWTLETGNTIGIQHEENIVSFYKHNSVLLKKAGSFVQAGEAIAIIGNTGTISSGPHLHFELWINGKPVDPQRFISFE